jgi:anti-sigma B factor antagonist
MTMERGDPLLRIEPTEAPGGLAVRGELDCFTVDQLALAVQALLDSGGDLTLDLSELSFLDASGIRLLVRTADTLRSHDALLTVIGSRSIVHRALNIAQLDRLPNVRVTHP